MSKEFRQTKRAFKKEGYSRQEAKRMATEELGGGSPKTEIIYKKGGLVPISYKKGGLVPTSKKRTSKRAKTTNGGYGNGI